MHKTEKGQEHGQSYGWCHELRHTGAPLIELGLGMRLGWENGLDLRFGVAGDIPMCGIGWFRAGLADRMFLYNLENLFLKKPCVYCCKITNRSTQNDRKKREKFSCFHQES